MQSPGNQEQLPELVVNLVPVDSTRLAQAQSTEGLPLGADQNSDGTQNSLRDVQLTQQNLVNTGEGSHNAALLTSPTEDPNQSPSNAGSETSNQFEDTVEEFDHPQQNPVTSPNTASSTPS